MSSPLPSRLRPLRPIQPPTAAEAANSAATTTTTDNVIPLPNVTVQILSKVIEYCKRHVDAAAAAASKAGEKLSSDENSL